MGQSLHNLLVHVVFGTKAREDFIDKEVKDHLYRYFSVLCRERNVSLIQAGGMADHVHLLIRLSSTTILSKLIGELKAHSSRWIKLKGIKYNDFAWQGGYGAFSVSESGFETCLHYIVNQAKHHANFSYKTELETLLKKSNVPYEPEFLWS